MSDLSGVRRGDDARQEDAPEVPEPCPFCGVVQPPNVRVEADTLCDQCASPLYPVDRLEEDGADRRSLPRVLRAGQIGVFTRWPQQAIPGFAEDLSPAGIKFVFGRALELEQIIKIRGEHFRAIARVASCRRQVDGRDPSYVIGAAFLTRRFDRAQGTFVSTSI